MQDEGARGLNVAQRCIGHAGIRSGRFSIPSIGRPARFGVNKVLGPSGLRPHAYMKLFGIPFLTASARVDIRVSTVILLLATTPVFLLFFLNTCLRSIRHIFLVIHPSGAWCYTYRVSRRVPWGSIML